MPQLASYGNTASIDTRRVRPDPVQSAGDCRRHHQVPAGQQGHRGRRPGGRQVFRLRVAENRLSQAELAASSSGWRRTSRWSVSRCRRRTKPRPNGVVRGRAPEKARLAGRFGRACTEAMLCARQVFDPEHATLMRLLDHVRTSRRRAADGRRRAQRVRSAHRHRRHGRGSPSAPRMMAPSDAAQHSSCRRGSTPQGHTPTRQGRPGRGTDVATIRPAATASRRAIPSWRAASSARAGPAGFGIIGTGVSASAPTGRRRPSAAAAAAACGPPARRVRRPRGGINIPPQNEQRFVPNEVVLEFAGNLPPQAITALAARHRLARIELVTSSSPTRPFPRPHHRRPPGARPCCAASAARRAARRPAELSLHASPGQPARATPAATFAPPPSGDAAPPRRSPPRPARCRRRPAIRRNTR